MYAVGSAVYGATSNGLSISTDFGATFTNYTTANGLGNNLVYGVYAVGPAAPGLSSTVYAATLGGLSISFDGGATFTNYTTAVNSAGAGLGSNIVFGVFAAGSPTTIAEVYAATSGGLTNVQIIS